MRFDIEFTPKITFPGIDRRESYRILENPVHEAQIVGQGSTNNQVLGNMIGVDINGTLPLGNNGNGISIVDGEFNTIGGSIAQSGNLIAYNDQAGIAVFDEGHSTNGNHVLQNSIFDNNDLGIDLRRDGVTPNDLLDPDTGANTLQNFPELLLAFNLGDSLHIFGFLKSTPNKSFSVQFYNNPTCDTSGYGEGETYLSSLNVDTGDNGDALFSAILPMNAQEDSFISATATDPDGNTSEFSACIAIHGHVYYFPWVLDNHKD